MNGVILVRCKFIANENMSFNYSGIKFEWTTLRDIQLDTSFKSRSGKETLAANKRPSGQYAHQETILGVTVAHKTTHLHSPAVNVDSQLIFQF